MLTCKCFSLFSLNHNRSQLFHSTFSLINHLKIKISDSQVLRSSRQAIVHPKLPTISGLLERPQNVNENVLSRCTNQPNISKSNAKYKNEKSN